MRTIGRVGSFEAEHSGAFHAYLRQAVRNRIRDEIRRVNRRPALDGTLSRVPDQAPSPIEKVIGAQDMRRYEAALARVSEPDREAIVARIEFGLSFREVARALGKRSDDAARMAVRRAVSRLAKELAVGR